MRALLLAGLLFCASGAAAADLSIALLTPAGAPVADAVVTFHPNSGTARPAARSGLAMVQRNIRFEPGVLVVPVGSTVQFPNQDRVRHHVYSFSRAKRFELRLFGHDETRSVLFDQPGVVAIGCNIHDQMSGHIVVVDTPYVARSGQDGRATLAGLAAGGGTLTVWHPRLRSGSAVTRTVTLPAGVRQTLVVDLRAGA